MSNLAKKIDGNLVTRLPAERKGVMQFRTFEETVKYANFICNTTSCPKQYINKPNEIVLAIEYLLVLGVHPIVSLPDTAVTYGRLQIFNNLPLAICMMNPEYQGHEEIFIQNTCTAIFKIRRNGQEFVGEFSQKDAMAAGLWDKRTEKGLPSVWMKYPKDMLRRKARKRAIDLGFSDMLCGLSNYNYASNVKTINPLSGVDIIETLDENETIDMETGEVTKMTLNEYHQAIRPELKNRIEALRQERELGCEFSDWMVNKEMTISGLTDNQALRWISWMEKQPLKQKLESFPILKEENTPNKDGVDDKSNISEVPEHRESLSYK